MPVPQKGNYKLVEQVRQQLQLSKLVFKLESSVFYQEKNNSEVQSNLGTEYPVPKEPER